MNTIVGYETQSRQVRRSIEREVSKNAHKKFAIKFRMSIAGPNAFTMLSVISMDTVKNIQDTCDYNNDKCLDIIMETAINIPAKINRDKAGQPLTAREEESVQQSMRNVSLAVLKMIQNDQYRSVGIQPDCVMYMDLMETKDGRMGFNLLEGPGQQDNQQQMISVHRGIANELKEKDIDCLVELN